MNAGLGQHSSLAYIPGLDGLRALSVLTVLFFHFTTPFTAPFKALGGGWEAWARAASVGGFGVDVFFVLSGYLIAKILTHRPVASAFAYRDFIARRAWRLLPTYIVALLVFTIAALAIKPHSQVLSHSWLAWTMTLNLVTHLGNVGTLLGDDTFSLVHFWSLAAEWHFYLALPILIRVTRSVRRAALVLIFIAIAVRLAFHAGGVSHHLTYSFTLCRIDALAFGCLFASLPFDAFKGRSRAIGVAGVAMFVLTMSSIASADVMFKEIGWLRTWGYSFIALSVVLMLVGVLGASSTSLPIRVLESRPMLAIGRASYSIYVWHLIFFPLIRNFTHEHFPDPTTEYWVVLPLALTVSGVLGWLSYQLVETSFARFRERRTKLVPRTSP
jgi:peptidoglycan/LPS O-acetylase OafA/YrhL